MTRKQITRLINSLEVYSFILPLVIVMLLFLAYPILQTINMSFHDWDLSRNNPSRDFVGLDNYARVVHDEYFSNSIIVSLKYIFVTVFGRFMLGLVVALIMKETSRRMKFFKTLIIIPWAVPEVIAAFIWVLMLNRDIGIINYILRSMGIITKNIDFLQNGSTALGAAMIVNIWKGFPFVAIMLYAGLQSIPSELYEAAAVDGANLWQKTRMISIPMLKPVSSVVFLLLITWTIRDFGIAYILAEGGPVHRTEIFTIFVFKKAFKYFAMGEAAAAACMMLVVCIFVTVLYLRALEEG